MFWQSVKFSDDLYMSFGILPKADSNRAATFSLLLHITLRSILVWHYSTPKDSELDIAKQKYKNAYRMLTPRMVLNVK